MNKAKAVNRAAAVGLVAMLPHPQARAYLRVCREVCGCVFDRHVQGLRLEAAGLRCPVCGDTSPSPPVPAPILLDTPKERKPHKTKLGLHGHGALSNEKLTQEVKDLRKIVGSLVDAMIDLIAVNNLKEPPAR
jgi:hypothetical protein